MLVWDRNGNGTIDNGRELFGDATLKSDGTLATDGFNALADLDANHDGIVNAQDTDFANLKVWRDLNQDGISQGNELFSLDSYQIAGINLAGTIVNTAQGNGNTLHETGSYLLSDGTTGLVGDINLANNAFYSQFADALPLSAEIQALPDMQGAGMVRGLRDAASRSPQLADTLGQYAASTSDLQKAMLDTLLSQWSATGIFTTTADRMATLTDGISHTTITLQGIEASTPAYTAFMDKLSLVEKFNGRTFQPLPTDPTVTLSYTILSAQQALIDQSYQALKNSVYDSLLLQTRFKPYLDALTLEVNNDSIIVDTSHIDTVLDTLSLTDAKGALLDLLELNRVEGQRLKAMGWAGIDVGRLAAYAEKVSIDPQLQTILNDWHIRIGSGTVTGVAGDVYIFGENGNDVLNGTGGNEILRGGAGNDTINSGGGDDTVYGGDGNDTITFSIGANNTIEGGSGNDLIKMDNYNNYNYANTVNGGTGNDRIQNGSNADTYLFNRGDGQDTISDYDNYNANKTDQLVFGTGIAVSDISVSRLDGHLLIKINDPANPAATDQITIEAWDNSQFRIEQVQFADGTVLTAAQLTNLAMTGTDAADSITLWPDATWADGKGGNDTITDSYGNNTLYGGDGNDTLTSGTGNDTLDGGTGVDSMTGGTGNDVYMVDNVGDVIMENLTGGTDTIQSSVSYTLADALENLTLTGSSNVDGTGNSLNNVIVGNVAANILNGGSGNDLLNGDWGNDLLNGDTGNDILQGGADNDTLADTAGVNLLDGGSGIDTLSGNAANEMFVGGIGNDTITTGNGADIIVFNRGDGMDVVNGGVGTDNTLSLGGGIRYADLALSKSGNDLILEVGNADQITLSSWYDTTVNRKSVLNLQVITDVMAGYDPASSDPLLNKSIQNYDFTAIVNAFDQANGGSANFMHWSATNSLLAAHLSASDTDALGGDLAYQYGKVGNFSGIGINAAQSILADAAFGTGPQALKPLAGLQDGTVRLV